MGGNIRYIQQLSGLDVTTTSREKLRQELSEKTELTDDEMQVEDWLNELIGYTRYKIQDVYLGISSYPEWVVYRKMPEQVLLKSIKICKYK